MVRLSAAKKTNRDAFTRIPASGAESLVFNVFHRQ
jgi:hypothetical protein